tara:strand:+ start:1896 stop:2021 length:126 start_codon:yes stop_codon:yes gene_type:complete
MDEWSKNIFLEHAWKNKKTPASIKPTGATNESLSLNNDHLF